jgi:DNA-binding response OmpR family regulator
MTRILIIEDDPKYRSVLRKNLEPLGYVVFEAGDGDEGLKCLASNLPEVVLVDLLMPNKEGIETIREIRTTYPTVRIIAMSGGGQSRAIDFLNVAKKLGEMLYSPNHSELQTC